MQLDKGSVAAIDAHHRELRLLLVEEAVRSVEAEPKRSAVENKTDSKTKEHIEIGQKSSTSFAALLGGAKRAYGFGTSSFASSFTSSSAEGAKPKS